MDGMEVIEITGDRVRLAKRTESGIESFVVRFRRTANPARSPDRPKIAVATRPTVDLTAKYKLSGVGRIGGAHFAVLDGKDYGVGDSLDGLKIVRIANDAIHLEKAAGGGRRSYVIRFRIRSKK
jgi:hypothetical protein